MSTFQPMVWPMWVVTEDSSVVWTRHDAGPEVIAEAESCTTEPGWTVLSYSGPVSMVRGTADPLQWSEVCGWNYDEPLLQESDEQHDLQDAMRYTRWEVVAPDAQPESFCA